MSKKDERYAYAVCLLVVLAMSVAGWYENYVPAPEADIAFMQQAQERR